jgi:hypothetical protein
MSFETLSVLSVHGVTDREAGFEREEELQLNGTEFDVDPRSVRKAAADTTEYVLIPRVSQLLIEAVSGDRHEAEIGERVRLGALGRRVAVEDVGELVASRAVEETISDDRPRVR